MKPNPSKIFIPLLILTFILVVAAWINPRISVNNGPVDVIVLWDQSLSIDHDAQQKVWQQLRTQIASLPERSQLAFIRFASNLRLETALQSSESAPTNDLFASNITPQPASLFIAGTNIEAALKEAINLSIDQKTTRILLVTDGAETQGNAIALLEDTRIQLIALRLPLSPDTRHNRLMHISAPHQVSRGLAFRIDIEMHGNIGSASNLSCRLNKTLISSNVVTFHNTQQFTSLTTKLTKPGLSELTCMLASPHNQDKYTLLINALRPQPTLLYLYGQQASARLVDQLATMNLKIDHRSASQLSSIKQLTAYDLLILDNISTDDLLSSDWQKIASAVNSQGTGLLVIAGNRAFSHGAYRNSLLEGLLPISLENPRTEQAIAAQFLIDRSGSMAADGDSNSPLFHAKQAISNTLQLLENHDQLGIVSFAADVSILAPLQDADQVHAVDITSSLTSQGGTRLFPALEHATAALNKIDLSNKFLFLITDGKLASDDTDRCIELLRNSALQIILFHVGNNTGSNLLALTHLQNVKRLGINDIQDLPKLVRKEVEQIKSPLNTTPIRPQATRQWLTNNYPSWPMIHSHYVTTIKSAAQPLLVSPDNTPLLALHQQGFGRVAATTFALEPWYEKTSWPQRQLLLPTILEFITPQPLKDWHMRLDFSQGPTVLKAESISGKTATAPLTASLTINKRLAKHLTLEESLPKLYAAQIPHLSTGTLEVTLSHDGKQSRQYFFLGEQLEWRARGNQFWQQLNRFEHVDVQKAGDEWQISRSQTELHSRAILLVLALLVYCVAMTIRLGLHENLLKSS